MLATEKTKYLRALNVLAALVVVAGCGVCAAQERLPAPTTLTPQAQPSVVTPAAEPPANSDLAFETRLAAVDAKMAAVVDLRADFEQRKKTAMLKKPMLSQGVLLCKGEKVLWRTAAPRKSDLLVSEGKVTIYHPRDELAEIYPLGSGFKDAAGGPLPKLAKLRESFEFVQIDAAEMVIGASARDLQGRIAMKLIPKTEELKRHVAWVLVLIDESIPCADRVVIVDPEGDETELRFSAIRINTGLKDADLDLKLPQRTKISTMAGTSK